MDFEQITTELADRVLTVTLNRPERLNAWTATMGRELIEAFDRADADDEVRVIIVTGAGRGYCAGADLAGGGETFDYARASAAPGRCRATTAASSCCECSRRTKPVIAAINGPAVGVGATMTLPMDIRLAAEDARIGFVFTRRGIVPEACSSWFLPRIVGISRAMEWVATGRVFSAQEALEGGLAPQPAPAGELLDAARAPRRARSPRTRLRSRSRSRGGCCGRCSVPSTRCSPTAPTPGACSTAGQSADAVEGVTSFLEKRPPRFTDRVSDGLPDILPGWTAPEFE